MKNKRINSPSFLFPFWGFPFLKAFSLDPKKRAQVYFSRTEEIGLYVIIGLLGILAAFSYFYLMNRDFPSLYYYYGYYISLISGSVVAGVPIILKMLVGFLRPSKAFIKNIIDKERQINKEALFKKKNLYHENILGIEYSDSEKPLSNNSAQFRKGYSCHQEVKVIIVNNQELIVVKRLFSLLSDDIYDSIDNHYLRDITSFVESDDEYTIRLVDGIELYLAKNETSIEMLNSLRARVRNNK
jgi:hypothetical protein